MLGKFINKLQNIKLTKEFNDRVKQIKRENFNALYDYTESHVFMRAIKEHNTILVGKNLKKFTYQTIKEGIEQGYIDEFYNIKDEV